MDERMNLIISTAWTVLAIVGRWLLFRKAGKPGWHSLFPIMNAWDEYDMCWKGWMIIPAALLAAVIGYCAETNQDSPVMIGVAVAAILCLLIIHWKESMKLARAFGKGGFTGFLLFLSDKVGRVILGLSSAEYVGKE